MNRNLANNWLIIIIVCTERTHALKHAGDQPSEHLNGHNFMISESLEVGLSDDVLKSKAYFGPVL